MRHNSLFLIPPDTAHCFTIDTCSGYLFRRFHDMTPPEFRRRHRNAPPDIAGEPAETASRDK